MGTKTSKFGTTRRESHDSSEFYNRKLFDGMRILESSNGSDPQTKLGTWADRIYHADSCNLDFIPDNSIALAFTSPPYLVGKEYDVDVSLSEYLGMIQAVGEQVYQKLIVGGRYVINIANLGRKPYISMVAHFYAAHPQFLPFGEIIWQKGKGANNSCAWGSWMSASAPRLRDIHEYLVVFAKETYTRPDKGISDIGRDEFMANTLSVWMVPPARAKQIGHPAPFPIPLALRVIRLFSYVNDVVLDPFVGSGTTCVAASMVDRHYVGVDTNKDYCELAEERIRNQICELWDV